MILDYAQRAIAPRGRIGLERNANRFVSNPSADEIIRIGSQILDLFIGRSQRSRFRKNTSTPFVV